MTISASSLLAKNGISMASAWPESITLARQRENTGLPRKSGQAVPTLSTGREGPAPAVTSRNSTSASPIRCRSSITTTPGTVGLATSVISRPNSVLAERRLADDCEPRSISRFSARLSNQEPRSSPAPFASHDKAVPRPGNPKFAPLRQPHKPPSSNADRARSSRSSRLTFSRSPIDAPRRQASDTDTK